MFDKAVMVKNSFYLSVAVSLPNKTNEKNPLYSRKSRRPFAKFIVADVKRSFI